MEAVRVLISYAHEPDSAPATIRDDHTARVLALANRLRRDNVDAQIDLYTPPPPLGWDRWMKREFTRARWVVIVWTATYRRRYEHREEVGKGLGVTWEARLVRGELLRNPSCDRFVPVVFSKADTEHIPDELFGIPHHRVDLEVGYETLKRHLLQTSEVAAPPLGETDQPARSSGLPELHAQSMGASTESPPAAAMSRHKRARPRKRLLFVAANRAADTQLALGRELREITTALRRSSNTVFDVHVLWAASDGEIKQELLDFEPDIFHMAGHGTPGGFVLEHTEPGSELRVAEAFRDWLKVALNARTKPLDIAVLNFCHTHGMLDVLDGSATLVVGPTQQVGDNHAITFASAFYTALAAGATSSFAYYLGEAAVAMSADTVGPTRDVEAWTSLQPAQDKYGIRCSGAVEPAVLAGAARRTARKTIAFFASEPDGVPRMRLDQELRCIANVMRGRRFHLEQRWATRVSDFLHTLTETRPTIIHLAGQGMPRGTYLFEDDRRPGGVVAPYDALSRVLTAFHRYVECAVLMFGYSDVVARELNDVLDYVVAIEDAANDATCRSFSEEFYRMVCADKSYKTAFDAGITAVPRADQGAFRLRGRRA